MHAGGEAVGGYGAYRAIGHRIGKPVEEPLEAGFTGL